MTNTRLQLDGSDRLRRPLAAALAVAAAVLLCPVTGAAAAGSNPPDGLTLPSNSSYSAVGVSCNQTCPPTPTDADVGFP